MSSQSVPPLAALLQEARHRIDSLEKTHHIGGRFLTSAHDGKADVDNPATGEALCEVAQGSETTVDLAVQAAKAALPAWRSMTPAMRAGVLVRLADAIDENTELFAAIETLNVGKPISVSRAEIPVAADALRFMAGAVRTAQAPAAGEYTTGQLSIVQREPIGVVGSITPWNYPLMMAVWKFAPALAVGNTVVLKPSELTPLSTLLFAEIAADILPPGVLNIILGRGETVGEEIARHPGIGMVSLTGSVRSGRAVATAAAASLKRVHLELGGKAPVVVFADADLDAVAETVALMGYWNSGQECGSATRLLCEASVHDMVVDRVSEAVRKITVGDPADGDHIDMGPLISVQQRDRVGAAISGAVADGATITTGGAAIDRPGSYFEPTVISDIRAGQRIAREEIFGPVVTIERFESEAEAIERSNDVDYGLAASVWTENTRQALRMVDALDFGTVWVNSHLTLASEMPWGGFGTSGYGRDMSTLALDDYTRTKHVMVSK